MHFDQEIYRNLWEQILNNDSDRVYEEIIDPWLDGTQDELTWLVEYTYKAGHPYPEVEIEDLWRLYALSRVNDICLTPFQTRQEIKTIKRDKPPGITLEQYIEMFRNLGIHVVNHDSFHPFFHEIVSVEQTEDDDHPIQLTDIKWPSLMLGDMMFSRAGVSVRGGRKHIRKDIAQTSTMYWTYWRKYRNCHDRSEGWGSNSSWRTRFRRDYFVNGRYFYNVDGMGWDVKVDLNNPKITLTTNEVGNATRQQRIELLRNRCFIYTNLQPDHDLWPYADFFHERA